MYRFSLNLQLLEAVGKLHNILQTGFQGWGSLILGRHILCHHRERILSHRRIFGTVLVSIHLYLHKTDRDGSILRQQLENERDGVIFHIKKKNWSPTSLNVMKYIPHWQESQKSELDSVEHLVLEAWYLLLLGEK